MLLLSHPQKPSLAGAIVPLMPLPLVYSTSTPCCYPPALAIRPEPLVPSHLPQHCLRPAHGRLELRWRCNSRCVPSDLSRDRYAFHPPCDLHATHFRPPASFCNTAIVLVLEDPLRVVQRSSPSRRHVARLSTRLLYVRQAIYHAQVSSLVYTINQPQFPNVLTKVAE